MSHRVSHLLFQTIEEIRPISSPFYRRKPKVMEEKKLTGGHSASRWQSQHGAPGGLTLGLCF